MKISYQSIFIICSFLMSGWTVKAGIGNSGDSVNDSLKFLRITTRAELFYEEFNYPKGIKLYKKALQFNKESVHVHLKIAEGYMMTHSEDSALNWFGSVVKMDSSNIANDYLRMYAEALTRKGKYNEALYWYQSFARQNPSDMRASDKIDGLERILLLYKDSSRYTIRSSRHNSSYHDFSPTLAGSGHDLVFVSSRGEGELGQFLKPKYQRDQTYYLNLFSVGKNKKVEIFDKRISSFYHEGPATFYDGGQKMIFTRNSFEEAVIDFSDSKLKLHGARVMESNKGVNHLQLFYSSKNTDGSWEVPSMLDFNSPEFSTAHPTVSMDGKTLYFASDRPGGYGLADLYLCEWQGNSWGEPINMGPSINTEGNDMFPFISNDGVLYFASDGHEGLGGLDLFKVRLSDQENWPVNLGYPINSPSEDFGICIIHQDEVDYGWFSSNRPGGMGLDDIYEFSYQKVKQVKGEISWTREGKKNFTEIKLKVNNEFNGDVFDVLVDSSGRFEMTVAIEDLYTVTVVHKSIDKAKIQLDPESLHKDEELIIRLK